jgi:hypothetical protein
MEHYLSEYSLMGESMAYFGHVLLARSRIYARKDGLKASS